MVPGSASAMRQGASQSLQNSTPGYIVENIDEKFQQLARIFEIASGETRVRLKIGPISHWHVILLLHEYDQQAEQVPR